MNRIFYYKKIVNIYVMKLAWVKEHAGKMSVKFPSSMTWMVLLPRKICSFQKIKTKGLIRN